MRKALLFFIVILSGFVKGYSQNRNEILDKNCFKIELKVGSGSGFKDLPLGTTDKGDKITLSLGGGTHIGAAFGYLVSRKVELSFDVLYQVSRMIPKVNNGSGSFDRVIIAPAFKYIIDLNNIYKINLGAGVNIVEEGTMDIDASQAKGGAHNIFVYEPSVGPELLGELEMFINKRWSFKFGLKYYLNNYTLISMKSNGQYIPLEFIPPEMKNEVDNLNGDGLDFSLGLALHL